MGYPAKPKEYPPTPLQEALADWRFKYELTDEEAEVLFAKASGAVTLRDLAKLRGCSLAQLSSQGLAASKKCGSRRLTPAALRLSQDALALATFDKEKRDAKREESDNDESEC